jgi:hypothetical protein
MVLLTKNVIFKFLPFPERTVLAIFFVSCLLLFIILFVVLYDVPDEIRTALHNTIFYDVRNITENDMANITFRILKVVRAAAARELTDGEFYVSSSEMQFFAHKIDAENVEHGALVLFSTYSLFCFIHMVFLCIQCI